MAPNASDDRREYYRIQDHIGLEVRPLEPDPPEDTTRPFDPDHLAALHSELRRVDQDVRNQLASLAEKDRLLANLLKSLNTKVDTLARIMAFEQNPLQPQQWRDVTLSEGGIAFPLADAAFSPGDAIAVRMTLPPELYRPVAVAEVVSIREDPEGAPWAHADFRQIDDADRQQIARHVMRWQVRQRKRERVDIADDPAHTG
ncbi:PilZ domain-containing protein [Marinobacter sp. JSM 1782161]|uniref:PilZ domain-containing protein n=1 Tax=Marinobacter sp. JSM 1782161 TaxID=2685906 RepID=UPI001403AFD2|nr:PilZ domain-containing protein [Marinobacter sp. JSM 1782161]